MNGPFFSERGTLSSLYTFLSLAELEEKKAAAAEASAEASDDQSADAPSEE